MSSNTLQKLSRGFVDSCVPEEGGEGGRVHRDLAHAWPGLGLAEAGHPGDAVASAGQRGH